MSLQRVTTNRSIEDGIAMYKQRIIDAEIIYEKFSATFRNRDCPVCGNAHYSYLDKFINKYILVTCDRCGTLYNNPSPTEEALDFYYTKCANQLLNVKMFEKRKSSQISSYLHDSRISELKKLICSTDKRPLKILEIGTASGAFLERVNSEFAESEIDLTGIDLDEYAVKTARDKGLNVIHGNVESLLENKSEHYDIIMHFELIEHLINPRYFTKQIFRLLTEGGCMLFTTVNGEGLDSLALPYNQKDRLLAHPIFPPMHLTEFNTRNIYFMLLDLNFGKINITTPGKLDIDLINVHHRSEMKEVFRSLADQPEQSQEIIQNLLAELKASSHMMVTAMKCSDLNEI
jgi:2-polyprenyl-3-methyl-5-hydroxy-6-metoxy-1,4-benzoquinol methylase